MKQRKFYVVYLYEGADYPESGIFTINTREHGMTEKLIGEIKREVDRQKRAMARSKVSFLNLIELDE